MSSGISGSFIFRARHLINSTKYVDSVHQILLQSAEKKELQTKDNQNVVYMCLNDTI